MTPALAPAHAKRKWFRLAVRHMRMAIRLYEAGFADGAAFHAYHAYECALSAMIAAHGYAVPPEGWTKTKDAKGKTIGYYPAPGSPIQEGSAHKARILLFNQVADRTKPYFTTHNVLSRFLNVAMRNDTLYYNAHQQILPQQRFGRAFVSGLLPHMRQFLGQVWYNVR